MKKKFFLYLPDINGKWNLIKDFGNNEQQAIAFVKENYDSQDGIINFIHKDGNDYVIKIPNADYLTNKSLPQYLTVAKQSTFDKALKLTKEIFSSYPNNGAIDNQGFSNIIIEEELYEYQQITIDLTIKENSTVPVTLKNLQGSDILDIIEDEIKCFVINEGKKDPTSILNLIKDVKINLEDTDLYEIYDYTD